MYNLIDGKSFFFESYSAIVIAEILSTKRNEVIDVDYIATQTGIAASSIIEFIELSLIDAGLITRRVLSKDEIRISVLYVLKSQRGTYHRLSNCRNGV